ncbi:tRNA-2-methylthio-N(6)-dimethylallyladenosine synthase [Elysia marginata]|uniref:tRNA-2-methylthio-N(6)-dimethylallyladenosine synthase n=1 Tax=Elysia marginata TaxID=1093978 RepID=A0AAV4I1J1_9GAST|nr:tRNA-2-methylthio-N(6)-dimethylallyladenosine synthase [Elysia marginata]
MRLRFSTSNPQDMSLEVLKVMAKYPNICKHIHLPVQSGNNEILRKMNRQHTREEYMELIDNIRTIMPDCAISHDIIAGFPTETETAHQDTLSLMEYVKYDFGFMFVYSERPGTRAARKMKDDVDVAIKKRRLSEIVALQGHHSLFRMEQHIGKVEEVLVEGDSKKSSDFWMGRNSQHKTVVFPKKEKTIKGAVVSVKIDDCTSATLLGNQLIS